MRLHPLELRSSTCIPPSPDEAAVRRQFRPRLDARWERIRPRRCWSGDLKRSACHRCVRLSRCSRLRRALLLQIMIKLSKLLKISNIIKITVTFKSIKIRRAIFNTFYHLRLCSNQEILWSMWSQISCGCCKQSASFPATAAWRP